MTKDEEIHHVWKNRDLIITQKTNAIKHADVVLNYSTPNLDNVDKSTTNKEGNNVIIDTVNPTVLNAKLVINTTNLIDSHLDCHIPNIWKKSLQESKQLLLLQEHEMEFDKIIADSLVDKFKAYTQTVSFQSLGFDYQGFTEALIFDVQIKKEVNEFMFNLYKNGRVSQHSVGMRYIKIFMCVNSMESIYTTEKANWDKYYPMVANPDVANEKGYFWAVTEAKVIEGSAVVKGSNHCTPVMEMIEENYNEPLDNTQENNIVPLQNTQKSVTELLQNIPNLIKI
jgi:hypothetical protein